MSEWIISSTILLLLVIGLRYALGGRLNPGLQYALWGLVLLRLLLPINLMSSPASVLNAFPFAAEASETVSAGASLSNNPKEPIQPNQSRPESFFNIQFPANDKFNIYSYSPKDLLTLILGLVWLSGAAAFTIWFTAANLSFYRKLKRTRRIVAGNHTLPVYNVEELPSPCVFGLFRPAVYITPAALKKATTLSHVLAHEKAHLKHGDNWWALFRSIALALHWYNPLVWWAAALSRRDGELWADASAIKQLGEDSRMDYGDTLVSLISRRTHPKDLFSTATTMTNGKRGIVERIKRIAHKPKMALTTLVAVLLMAAVAVGCTFTGAAGRKGGSTLQYVTLTSREQSIASISGDFTALMEIEFTDEIGGMALYIEQWANGEKLDSSLLMSGAANERLNLYLTSDILKNEELRWIGAEWNIMYEQQGTRVTNSPINYTFPDNHQALGSSSRAYGQASGKKTALIPGEDYILAARFFALTESKLVSGRTCEAITEDESLLSDFDYVNLIRLVLYATEEEAPADTALLEN